MVFCLSLFFFRLDSWMSFSFSLYLYFPFLIRADLRRLADVFLFFCLLIRADSA